MSNTEVVSKTSLYIYIVQSTGCFHDKAREAAIIWLRKKRAEQNLLRNSLESEYGRNFDLNYPVYGQKRDRSFYEDDCTLMDSQWSEAPRTKRVRGSGN